MDGTESRQQTVATVRLSARVLGLIVVGFSLLMFMGESLESGLPDANAWWDGGLALGAAYLLGLVLALRWERPGLLLGTAGLGALFILMFLGRLPGNVEGGFSLRGVLNPLFLAFWLPLVLYGLARRLDRRA